MKFDDFAAPPVVGFARQIIDMDNELFDLRREVAELREYREKYTQAMQEGIAHSQHMIGGMLRLAMVPGVGEAIAKNGAKGEVE